jgi:CHASE1-domain containing sensor protein
VVADAKGAPVVGAPVVIKVRVAFGWLSIARASTDQAGRARVDLPATLRSGEVSAEAGDDGQARAAVRFGEETLRRQLVVRPGRDALSALSPQPGFISPYPVPLQVALLGLILGGIWTTYGYVVWLLSRIRGAREDS